MIKSGDKFTVKDLRQSVQEVISCDVASHVKMDGLGALVVFGDTLVDILSLTPQTYAQYRMAQYNDIKSSAVNLDKQLRDKGFKTVYKFSYNYFTPELKPDQIVQDAYCLEYFQNLSGLVTPIHGHQKQLQQIFFDAFRVSYYYAQYLWACNHGVCAPIAQTLACPSVESWAQIISAILGVGFQFNPNDVYEFSVKHICPDISKADYDARYEQQARFKNTVMTKYGVDTGCLVLSPTSQDKLTKILSKTDTPYWVQVLQQLCRGKLR